MGMSAKQRLDNFMNGLDRRNPGQSEFHQAVYEVAADIIPFMQENPIATNADIQTKTEFVITVTGNDAS
jgi:hypothetical protein